MLEAIGCEVIPLDCELDHTFPRYNPNPEDMKMLHAISEAVLANKADVGLGFDGDGDRCGVVDNEGHEIFADKVGVMLARDLSARHPNAVFVADVKSTGLFLTDPVLQANGAKTLYWKTGHSYMKRYTHEQKALVGFEKSGHFFFQPPSAAATTTASSRRSPSATCSTAIRPSRSPTSRTRCPRPGAPPPCPPTAPTRPSTASSRGSRSNTRTPPPRAPPIAGQKIRDLVTVNGVRVTLADGTWGLVRASSNKPELVVVVESPTSEANMRAIFADIDARLGKFPEVGEYNQKNLRGARHPTFSAIGLGLLDQVPCPFPHLRAPGEEAPIRSCAVVW